MKKAAKKPKATKIKPKKKQLVKKLPVSKKAAKRPRRKTAAVPAATKQEILIHDMKAEQAKYYTGYASTSEPTYKRSAIEELEQRQIPARYDEDVVVLQIRDPWWAHSYWDVASGTINRLKNELGGVFDRARWVLRSYDVSCINFDGANAHRFFDTSIDFDARNWYLNFGSPGTSWCVDLGIILPDGRFITVVRSNTIALPLDGPSWVTDEEWMIPDDEFRRLYGMSVGLGPNVSSPVGKLWQERLKKDITSKGIASMVSSPVKKAKGKGAFWLVVDAELIVYGATEADARVTVQGKDIKLRKDGTFTLRFALPDGKQVIPVVAKSAHIDETRTITPIITRKTTRNP